MVELLVTNEVEKLKQEGCDFMYCLPTPTLYAMSDWGNARTLYNYHSSVSPSFVRLYVAIMQISFSHTRIPLLRFTHSSPRRRRHSVRSNWNSSSKVHGVTFQNHSLLWLPSVPQIRQLIVVLVFSGIRVLESYVTSWWQQTFLLHYMPMVWMVRNS